MWNFAWRYSDVSKERRLGRGLEFLLGSLQDASSTAAPTSVPASRSDPSEETAVVDVVSSVASTESSVPASDAIPDRLSVDLIDSNPFQPRTDFDPVELSQLAHSLTEYGLLQPLVVRRHGVRWQLVAGERRLRAARLAGWTEVPIRAVEADDRKLAELAIVENLQRKDLSALEKAASFERYLSVYQCKPEELARRLDLDRSTISNLIRLLDLPESIKALMRSGEITAGHARALLPLADEAKQHIVLKKIREEELSVRATEMIVQQMLQKGSRPSPESVPSLPQREDKTPDEIMRHLAELEREFRAALGTKVKLTQTSKGRGRLVISFATNEEFERIRHLLCGQL